MRIFSFLLVLTLGIGGALADDVAPSPQGILVLRAVAGADAGAVEFVSIQWVDNTGGYAVDSAGNKTPFTNDAIGRIIYFYQSYYEEVDHNQYWIDWRAGLQSREVIVPPVDTISLGPDDAPHLLDEEKILEDIVQRFPGGQALLTPMIAELKDDQTKLAGGSVLQNGKWIAAKDAGVAPPVAVVGEGSQLVTFTTKSGRKYVDAKTVITDQGISVITADGGSSVSFDDLPDDLSGFPQPIRDKIVAAKAQAQQEAATQAAADAAPQGFLAQAEAFVTGVVHSIWTYFSPAPASGSSDTTNAAPATNSDATNSPSGSNQ